MTKKHKSLIVLEALLKGLTVEITICNNKQIFCLKDSILQKDKKELYQEVVRCYPPSYEKIRESLPVDCDISYFIYLCEQALDEEINVIVNNMEKSNESKN